MQGKAKPAQPRGTAAAIASLCPAAMALLTRPKIAEAKREPRTADGSRPNMAKKVMFATAIASVRTFDPSSPAGTITRLLESANGVAAAAVYAPELLKAEQRWLMDTGCPYDLTTRGSIPVEWQSEIYQSDPVV